MTVQGETIMFNVYDAFKLPSDEHECFRIDTLCQIVQNTFDSTHGTDPLEKVLTQNPQVAEIDDDELLEAVQFLDACPAIPRKYTPNFIPLPVNTEKLVPSLDRAPELELKPLPSHLKYVYLGETETLPAIIASNLNCVMHLILQLELFWDKELRRDCMPYIMQAVPLMMLS
ncbi:hypothetical protein ACE6H2_027175 [Prunus campanulata]